jgi:dephospho-CoA kinase
MNIIGITGNLGAGKGTVVEYLKNFKGYKHFSARAFITKEIEKRGMPVDRTSMNIVSNDLREKHTPSYIIESLYHEARAAGGDCIIESIHTPGEIEALRKIGHFHLFAVTADLPVRYQRITLRGSATDHISFDTFVEQNKKESASTDPNKQNLNACIEKADFVFNNNGTIEELYEEIEEAFKKIEKEEN